MQNFCSIDYPVFSQFVCNPRESLGSEVSLYGCSIYGCTALDDVVWDSILATQLVKRRIFYLYREKIFLTVVPDSVKQCPSLL